MPASAHWLNCLLCYGPAAVLMLVALILEQRRHAPNGTDPRGNIVRRTLAGGLIAAAACWLFQYFAMAWLWDDMQVLAMLSWMLMPWAFALGEALALLTRAKSTTPDSMDA